MAQLQMYTAKLGSPQTTLAATLAADATSMVLTDASVLPAGPNIAVLGVDENCEIVKYTAIDSATNTVSGLVRGQGGSTARVWEAGSVVARNATSLDHDIFKANIEDLEANKANTADVYTQSEIDTALNAKADSSAVYTKSEVDTALGAKANTADLGALATQDAIDLDTQVSGVLKMSNGGTGGQSSILFLRPGDSFTISSGVTGFPAIAVSKTSVFFTIFTSYPIRSDVSSATLTAQQIAFRTTSGQIGVNNVELTSTVFNRCGIVFNYRPDTDTFTTSDVINASFRLSTATLTLS